MDSPLDEHRAMTSAFHAKAHDETHPGMSPLSGRRFAGVRPTCPPLAALVARGTQTPWGRGLGLALAAMGRASGRLESRPKGRWRVAAMWWRRAWWGKNVEVGCVARYRDRDAAPRESPPTPWTKTGRRVAQCGIAMVRVRARPHQVAFTGNEFLCPRVVPELLERCG